jgi:hypothetical protein
VLTVATAEGDDFVCARATVLLEGCEYLLDGCAVGFAQKFGEVHGIFECHGSPLARVWGYGVGGVADEEGAADAPTWEARDVVDGYVEDFFCGLDKLRYGRCPTAMQREEALLTLGHGCGGDLLSVFERS